MKTQTADSLPATTKAAGVKPPNYMVFVCSLDRIEKAAAKGKDAGRIERTRALRAEAVAAYKAKDYATAINLHNQAHGVATGEQPPTAAPAAPPSAEVEAVAAAGTPRPPKATKAKPGKKAPAAKAAPKPAPAKPAATKAAKEKAAKPAKFAKPTKGLSAMSAAAQVLAEAKAPMGVKAIVAAMSAQGLWTSPGGKTPHSTLAAALQRDIAAKGRDSRFKKVDKGLYASTGRGV